MELNKENKMKSEQAVLPNPCLEEEEEDPESHDIYFTAVKTSNHTPEPLWKGTNAVDTSC
jgi:hypothetical protein